MEILPVGIVILIICAVIFINNFNKKGKQISSADSPDGSATEPSDGSTDSETDTTGDGSGFYAKETTDSGNFIEITLSQSFLFQEKSPQSKIVGTTEGAEILEVMETGTDESGSQWIKVRQNLDTAGWIPSSFCVKPVSFDYFIPWKSNTGYLLDSGIDAKLFVSLLLMEEYTLDSFLKIFGENPVKVTEDDRLSALEKSERILFGMPADCKATATSETTEYRYKNGLYFNVAADGTVQYAGVDSKGVLIRSIRKKNGCLSQIPGGEIYILYQGASTYELLVLSAGTKGIIRNYATGCNSISKFEIGDFLHDGSQQIFLEEYEDSSALYPNEVGKIALKKAVYQLKEGELNPVFDYESLKEYQNGIKVWIEDRKLSFDLNMGPVKTSTVCPLPESLFYDNETMIDRNPLLSLDLEWTLVCRDGEWLVQVCNTVNFRMLRYDWEIPGLDSSMPSVLLNDLARVKLLFQLNKGIPELLEAPSVNIKYDSSDLFTVKPVGPEDEMLSCGLVLGMNKEEACRILCITPEDLEGNHDTRGISFFYKEELAEAKKVEEAPFNEEQFSKSQFDEDHFEGDPFEDETVEEEPFYEERICGISVTNPAFANARGVKCGDSAETVERIYGKPDVGFSGDKMVVYHEITGTGGDSRVCPSRGLRFYYENNHVNSFEIFGILME